MIDLGPDRFDRVNRKIRTIHDCCTSNIKLKLQCGRIFKVRKFQLVAIGRQTAGVTTMQEKMSENELGERRN